MAVPAADPVPASGRCPFWPTTLTQAASSFVNRAIEAALVAGLTGIGLPAGPAVSAVLTYRLATYWLPVVPGWAALRVLQRRGYV